MYTYPNGLTVTIEECIKRLRRNLCIHSYIYYTLNTNIVSDHCWQAWADELVHLQNTYPNLEIGLYDKEFADWTGATGMHLPKDDYVIRVAHRLLEYNKIKYET